MSNKITPYNQKYDQQYENQNKEDTEDKKDTFSHEGRPQNKNQVTFTPNTDFSEQKFQLIGIEQQSSPQQCLLEKIGDENDCDQFKLDEELGKSKKKIVNEPNIILSQTVKEFTIQQLKNKYYRGNEIKKWLKDNQKYLIVDFQPIPINSFIINTILEFSDHLWSTKTIHFQSFFLETDNLCIIASKACNELNSLQLREGISEESKQKIDKFSQMIDKYELQIETNSFIFFSFIYMLHYLQNQIYSKNDRKYLEPGTYLTNYDELIQIIDFDLLIQDGFLIRLCDCKFEKYDSFEELVQEYLKNYVTYDILKPLSKLEKTKIDKLGLICWLSPFVDQILDIIYLTTGTFYSPIIFYLFVISFFLSLFGSIAYTFYRFRSSQQMIFPNKKNISFFRKLIISILIWLKIDGLAENLGYLEQHCDLFYPEVSLDVQFNKKEKNYRTQKKKNLTIFRKYCLNDARIFKLINFERMECFQCSLICSYDNINHIWISQNVYVKTLTDVYFHYYPKLTQINRYLSLFYCIFVYIMNSRIIDESHNLNLSEDLNSIISFFGTQNKLCIAQIVFSGIHIYIFLFLIDLAQFHILEKKKRCDLNLIYKWNRAGICDVWIMVYIMLFDFQLESIFQLVYAYYELNYMNQFFAMTSQEENMLELMQHRYSFIPSITFIAVFILIPFLYIFNILMRLLLLCFGCSMCRDLLRFSQEVNEKENNQAERQLQKMQENQIQQ